MKKTIKVIILACIMLLAFICFMGCESSQTNGSNESDSSESVILQEPTLTVQSIEATYNSIFFVVEESDSQNVGEIKEIYINRKNEDPIYAINSEQREFLGVYSGSLYYLNIVYVYDVGNGIVSNIIKVFVNTPTVTIPEYSLEYSVDSYNSISFDVEINDPYEVSEITAIELISITSSEKVILDDLSKRTFTEIKPGEYSLEVSYKYDLNDGEGWIFDSIKESVYVEGELDIVDFIVEVPENREPVILHLSDPQIIDAGQTRPGRTGVDKEYWGTDKLQVRLLDYLEETIKATNPDLILITGDVVYGEFDDNGTSLIAFIEAMESFGIPWAPVFGNHDNESTKGVDWQCDRLEEAEHCLFLQRTLTGNGNYTVGISQGGALTRVFFMMDSNGCSTASSQSLANGHTKTSVGFGNDQIAWFESVGNSIKRLSPETKISFAFHIQLQKFADAYKQYGFTNSGSSNLPINIDTHSDKKESDFGFIAANLKSPWDTNNAIYNKMVAIGCDSIYVGHEHGNSASVVYEGVRFQFAQKIATYDRCNWLMPDGSIKMAYPDPGGDPIMGGTVNVLANDGRIKDAYIYYCGGVSISNPQNTIKVNGLSPLSSESGVMVQGVEFNGVNAYKCTANSQGKVYIDSTILSNKETFTFSVFIPQSSSEKLLGYGEFAIRTKPNEIDPIGAVTGYIEYNSSATEENLKLEFDKWQTFTVDISGFGDRCTEFAFVIATGNVIYIKDMAVS